MAQRYPLVEKQVLLKVMLRAVKKANNTNAVTYAPSDNPQIAVAVVFPHNTNLNKWCRTFHCTAILSTSITNTIQWIRKEHMLYPTPIAKLIDSYSKLPGIGIKTATRLAFYTIGTSDDDVNEFAKISFLLRENWPTVPFVDVWQTMIPALSVPIQVVTRQRFWC